MKRTLQMSLLVPLMALGLSCGGNSALDDTEAPVFLTVEVEEYNPEIDICTLAGVDVAIDTLNISSYAKVFGAVLTSQQDVNLTRWVIRPYRTDGGAVVSPEWIIDQGVYVPAGGSANLENWRVFPAEYFNQLPLSNLKPENGGVDPETGNRNIRQPVELQIFGSTVAGKAVATEPLPIAFNFWCFSP